MAFKLLCIVSLALANAAWTEQQATVTANPIRKVVGMLQAMQTKITAEGEKEQELFDKFMCYCKLGDDTALQTDAEGNVRHYLHPDDS